MEKIVSNKLIAPDIHKVIITAPQIAKTWRPGQFLIIHFKENSERIPLTVCERDLKKGEITMIIQAIGSGTKEICNAATGSEIRDVAGPLGKPTELHNDLKNVLFISGGIGIAPLLPVIDELHNRGIRITTLMGTRSRNTLILEDEVKSKSDNLIISTDDGTYGTHGLVISLVKEAVDKFGPFDRVFIAGPTRMMAASVKEVQKFKIPSTVSLNPIMIDGTGMCGGCRVTVGGKTKFACVDGPEFEGDLIDFDKLIKRLSTYKDDHTCKISNNL
ncbi:MAG TPA: sulfide/dihydroorotate dehydrogenase-like FAD/NAD-binding protein [bacterium]|nr:sulfide/dihydroorotate dehydrogenase-like FAD/NAD-binding protein [bacterium]HPS30783.1 sulfide/dihydroorotate dehydrogenase-like FAD/NAD-binding protein [bacterium]